MAHCQPTWISVCKIWQECVAAVGPTPPPSFLLAEGSFSVHTSASRPCLSPQSFELCPDSGGTQQGGGATKCHLDLFHLDKSVMCPYEEC